MDRLAEEIAREWPAGVSAAQAVAADVHHRASREWQHDRLSDRHRIVAPTLLLVEVVAAIGRRTGDLGRTERFVDLLRATPGMRWVALNGELRDHAAGLAAEHRLRGADAVYVALADHLGSSLVTWVAEQLNRAGARIKSSTPESASQ